MRFFHLADLHLGRVLHGYSLIEDQRFVLDFVLRQAELLRPDAIVIAGDIYDKAVPGVEATELLDYFLTELAETGIHVMIISGNHDSASRLGFGRHVLRRAKIHLVTRYSGSVERVTLQDAEGAVHFHLLPFIRPHQIKAAHPASSQCQTWDEAFNYVLAEMELEPADRHVLVAHQFFVGQDGQALLSDSEQSMIGTLDRISAEKLEPFDYVCLGHLHRAQKVRFDTVRYAGSPLVYSASELNSEKYLSVVDLLSDATVKLRKIPIDPLRPVRQITGRFADLIAAANDDRQISLSQSDDYLYVRLTDELPIQDAFARLKAHYPYLLEIRMDSIDRRIFSEQSVFTENPQELSLAELFEMFYRAETGDDMPSEWQADLRAQIERLTVEKGDGS